MFYSRFFEGKEEGKGKVHIIYIHARVYANVKRHKEQGYTNNSNNYDYGKSRTTVSSSGNDSFLKWKRQFPQVETAVSPSGDGSFPRWERQFPQVETEVTKWRRQ